MQMPGNGRAGGIMMVTARPTGTDQAAFRFLQLIAQLLLEYNERSEVITRQIDQVANCLGVDVHSIVAYREVTLVAADGRHVHAHAPELRINIAMSLGTLRVIDDLRAARIGLDEATRRLETLKATVPHHGRWTLAALFGMAAASLAWLLLADWVAVTASGVSAGLGLIARQQVARWHVVPFAPPFIAALIGGALGGMVIRAGWTHTPNLCLVVPALMLVPGPHLINSVNDMLENHMITGLCRLALATGVLLATALGVVFGTWLTLGMRAVPGASAAATELTLPVDVALAGLAACGFAAFYNAPWRVWWVSIVCGMVGHGLRFVCLQFDVGLTVATLLACLAIGILAQLVADRLRISFSAVAFAAAVPMLPGVFIYQSIASAMRLADAGAAADPALAAGTIALILKAMFVVGAMAIGLVLGSRIAYAARRRRGVASMIDQRELG
jgi:uncharacterized membrane protein YjjP (DUF1212 family)